MNATRRLAAILAVAVVGSARATSETQWPRRRVKPSCSGAAHVHETFRETSVESSFQNRVSSSNVREHIQHPLSKKADTSGPNGSCVRLVRLEARTTRCCCNFGGGGS